MAFLSASFFLGVLHVCVFLPSSSSTFLFVIDKRAVLNLDSILSGAPWDRCKFQVCLPFSQLLHQSPKGSSLENSTPSSLTVFGFGKPRIYSWAFCGRLGAVEQQMALGPGDDKLSSAPSPLPASAASRRHQGTRLEPASSTHSVFCSPQRQGSCVGSQEE